jgi:hypothetical protein
MAMTVTGAIIAFAVVSQINVAAAAEDYGDQSGIEYAFANSIQGIWRGNPAKISNNEIQTGHDSFVITAQTQICDFDKAPLAVGSLKHSFEVAHSKKANLDLTVMLRQRSDEKWDAVVVQQGPVERKMTVSQRGELGKIYLACGKEFD